MVRYESLLALSFGDRDGRFTDLAAEYLRRYPGRGTEAARMHAGQAASRVVSGAQSCNESTLGFFAKDACF
jgi:hypothetical protein